MAVMLEGAAKVTAARSLSDLKNRSENSAGRGQILLVLQVNSRSIDQKSGKIWTAQADLQPISFKSDRLLGLPMVLASLKDSQCIADFASSSSAR